VPAYRDYDTNRADIGHGLSCGEANPFWTQYQDGTGWKTYDTENVKTFRKTHRLNVLSRKLPSSTMADEPTLTDSEIEVQHADQVMKKFNKFVLCKHGKVNDDLVSARMVSKRIAGARGTLIFTVWHEKHRRWAQDYRKDIIPYIRQSLQVLEIRMPDFRPLPPNHKTVVYQKLFLMDAPYTAARFLASLDPVDVIAIYCFKQEGHP